jgi:hypothetical protein
MIVSRSAEMAAMRVFVPGAMCTKRHSSAGMTGSGGGVTLLRRQLLRFWPGLGSSLIQTAKIAPDAIGESARGLSGHGAAKLGELVQRGSVNPQLNRKVASVGGGIPDQVRDHEAEVREVSDVHLLAGDLAELADRLLDGVELLVEVFKVRHRQLAQQLDGAARIRAIRNRVASATPNV